MSAEILYCAACDDSWHWGHCPPCQGILPSSTRECPHCGTVLDAWLLDRAALSPTISLAFVMYPLLFEKRPQDRAAWLADQLLAASTRDTPSAFRRLRPGELEAMVRVIREELAHPTRQVSAVLPTMRFLDEAALRETLALVVARIEEQRAREAP